MPRSTWKTPNLKHFNTHLKTQPKTTSLRSATVSPELIGTTVYVHNGLKFLPLRVSENAVGFKLGAFAHTKKRVIHKKKKPRK